MGERKRIGLREVRALAPNSEIWDAAVAGFGARRQRSDAIAYVLLYRTKEGRTRRFTIGRHGAPWTPDTARDEAKRLLGEVTTGKDPSTEKTTTRNAATVADLCDLYLTEARAGRILTRSKRAKRDSTLDSDAGRIEKHIKPILGRLAVPAVTRDDAESFMHRVAEGGTKARTKTAKGKASRVRGGRGAASRCMGLLGAIFAYAVAKRIRRDNPVRGIARYADEPRDRRLTDAEYALLADGFRAAETGEAPARPRTSKRGPVPGTGALPMWPYAVAAARFLLLTGWRRAEATGLRWVDVDLPRRTARLGQTKTGASVRALSRPACELLRDLPRTGELVFPAANGKAPIAGPAFNRYFARIVARGGLPASVTPHVLRHSFASMAGDLGYSEATIATLIGHKDRTVTSRYIHAADAVLLAAADKVAGETLARMGEAPKVVALHPQAIGA